MVLLAPDGPQSAPSLVPFTSVQKVRVLYLDTTLFFGPLMQVHGRAMRYLDPDQYQAYLLADPVSGSVQSLRDLPHLSIWLQPLASVGDAEPGGWRRFHRLAHDVRILAGLPRAAWKLRQHRIGVLHVGMTARMLVVGLFLSVASGARLVVHAHEAPRPNNAPKKLLFKVAMAQAARVIAVSSFIKEKLASAGVNSRKITVVLNTVDLDRFHPGNSGEAIRSEYGIAPEDFLVVCLGRFLPGKGQLYLARAMAMVCKEAPNVKALLIGWEDPTRSADGLTYKERVVQYCREYDLSDTVIIGAPRPDAPEIMAAANMVAVPSTDDPCPLTVLEAMASGKPIVGFQSGGIPEEVGIGQGAILVKPCDETGLAQAILTLAGDPEGCRDLGRLARQRAEGSFYERRLSEQVMQVYQEVVGRVPAAPQGTLPGKPEC